jgi:hypothetical protein
VAVVVEVRCGAIPLLARSGVVRSRAHSLGDPCGRVARYGIDAALPRLTVEVVQLDLGRGALDELAAVLLEFRVSGVRVPPPA